MHPVLFKIGPVVVHTYGMMMALAFLAAMYISKREARIFGEDPDKIADLIFYILLWGILGARLFYVAVNFSWFVSHPLDVFKVWEGGLVFYGGFIGGLGAAFYCVRKRKIPFWKSIDILTPALPFGHFLGRIGCFNAGCCYGKACDLPWAVTFTDPQSLAPLHIPLHPTQLYESLANLALFGLIMAVRKKKRFEGQLFWGYVVVYGVMRFLIEFARGDERGSFLLGLSPAQQVGVLLCLSGAVMLFVLSKRAHREASHG